MTNEKSIHKKLRMAGKGNLQISAWFISIHNERYFEVIVIIYGNLETTTRFTLLARKL